MKYSIRGTFKLTDATNIVSTINNYQLWRLITNQTVNRNTEEIFTFEVWLNTESDKTSLFNTLKTFVDEYGESIDWHECTHDELASTPCVIVETYTGSE